jgi:adenosylcobinamide-GDP ribazoletransferase
VLVIVPTVALGAVLAATSTGSPDGMAATFAGASAREAIATTVLLVAALAAVLTGSRGFGALVVAPLTMLVVARLAAGRLGGLTGDVYGAIIEAAETASLVAVCLV